MKYFKIIATLLTLTVIFLAACNEKSKPPKSRATTPSPVALEPPQNASGVWHYTCSKRCAGGSGAIGNCTTCGAPLVHNALYHGNATSPPATAPYSSAPFATPPATTPSKNTAGQWHYTCTKGCAGGSGTAGACTTCGNTLAHNAAYH